MKGNSGVLGVGIIPCVAVGDDALPTHDFAVIHTFDFLENLMHDSSIFTKISLSNFATFALK